MCQDPSPCERCGMASIRASSCNVLSSQFQHEFKNVSSVIFKQIVSKNDMIVDESLNLYVNLYYLCVLIIAGLLDESAALRQLLGTDQAVKVIRCFKRVKMPDAWTLINSTIFIIL